MGKWLHIWETTDQPNGLSLDLIKEGKSGQQRSAPHMTGVVNCRGDLGFV